MGRRKLILFVAALLLIGTATVWWFPRHRERLALDLAFMGYGTQTVSVSSSSSAELPPTIDRPVAMMQASNSGCVPLELSHGVPITNLNAKDFGRPIGTGFPKLLKPGETGVFKVWPAQAPWWTEIGYRRHSTRERILSRIWDLAGSKGRRLLSHTDLWAPFQRVKCGPITNALPPPPSIHLTNHVFHLPPDFSSFPALDLHPRPTQRPFNINDLLTNYPPR